MALVAVVHLGRGCSGQAAVQTQRAHPTHAQQQLLLQAVVAAAAVQPVGDVARGVVVVRDVRVEQEQGDPAHVRAPDLRGQGASVGQGERHPRGRAVGLFGPPGCGKSRLIGLVADALRERERKVAFLRIGGAHEATAGTIDANGSFSHVVSPQDASTLLQPLVVLARAMVDLVIVEATMPTGLDHLALSACDSTLLGLQPSSEDCLALLEAELMALPDRALILKADRGAPTLPMVERLSALAQGRLAPLEVPCEQPRNLPAVLDLFLDRCSGEAERRHRQVRAWIVGAVQEERGRHGLTYMEAHLRRLIEDARLSPSRRARNILDAIARRAEEP